MTRTRACVALRLLLATAVSVVAAANVVRAGELTVPHEFLPLRDHLPLEESPFRQEVLSMMVAHPLEGSDASKMLETVREIRDFTTNARETEFFGALADMSEHDGHCTPALGRYVLTILSLIEETEEPAVLGYLAYLRSQARYKYGSCAKPTGENFERLARELPLGVEQALDELFMAYANANEDHSADQDLLALARGVNFVTGHYKTKRMLKVARDFTPEAARDQKLDEALELLAGFVQESCARLQDPLKELLLTFNLARSFGAKFTTGVSMRFRKLNEYNRACLTWQRDPEGARGQLEGRLKSSKWYKFKAVGRLALPLPLPQPNV